MPKKIIKKYLPSHEKIKENKHLKIFGDLLHNPNLWHLNRRSLSRAFAIGLFFCFVPLPTQMIMAAGVAILFHANLPCSVALVWLTNPVTMPVIFYGAYLVGATIVGFPSQEFAFELSWIWLENELSSIWKPFLLGCFLCGVTASFLGYYGLNFLWRSHVKKTWAKRRGRT